MFEKFYNKMQVLIKKKKGYMSGQALPGMIFSLQSETRETSALGLLQNAEHLLSTP